MANAGAILVREELYGSGYFVSQGLTRAGLPSMKVKLMQQTKILFLTKSIIF